MDRGTGVLSDMLSSRSYLDLSQEQPHMQGPRLNPLEEVNPEAHEPDRRVKSRDKRIPSKAPGTSEQVPESKSSVTPDRPARKRGRPKLETVKDAAAIEERRLQIRRAQRTYRSKKEATIQTLRSRVNSLEQTLASVSDLLGAHETAGGNSSNVDYLARTRELILAELANTTSATTADHSPQTQHADHIDVLGYQVSPPSRTSRNIQKGRTLSCTRPRSPSPLINRILPTSTIYTYSYQESNMCRRLHRFTLEHTYRWLTDSNTTPAQLSRVFGLVPCIHDMPGIIRSFRRTLQSEIGSTLEFVKMPYYTLGGAGTHYPRVRNGRPVLPENTRRPGKILRRMQRILDRGGIHDWDEDWSGDWDPVGLEMDDQERIRSLNLDGEWFDCHDVQGYLEYRGVTLDGALKLRVPETLVGVLSGVSPLSSVSSLYGSPLVTPNPVESWDVYTLDVECFFDLLLPNMRILGRAPGFRVGDVDAALRGAISRRPFA
ncbi:hypothetical protein N7541_008948 [Penicillium brevicompactum]|uniref:BZIP domain-containing protein n=1 Tax=Penicillium brevicompactum TaxID=5074 RepID=A0A9W9UL44_PENBR|nr:hypothetical protein N7541_008948 [Penicillium brevicompactum]